MLSNKNIKFFIVGVAKSNAIIDNLQQRRFFIENDILCIFVLIPELSQTMLSNKLINDFTLWHEW